MFQAKGQLFQAPVTNLRRAVHAQEVHTTLNPNPPLTVETLNLAGPCCKLFLLQVVFFFESPEDEVGSQLFYLPGLASGSFSGNVCFRCDDDYDY